MRSDVRPELPLLAARLIGRGDAEERASPPCELAVHVREDPVNVESNAQRHGDTRNVRTLRSVARLSYLIAAP